MEKKPLVSFLFLFTVFFLAQPIATRAMDLCSWRGYANISNTLVTTTDYIKTYNTTIVYNATIDATGFYMADVQVESTNNNVSFKICGVDAVQGAQTWPCSDDLQFTTLNLSITALANGASCTYSCACSGGRCCSGATEYTDGSGTGTCQSSACAAATTTTSGGGGGGGGGGAPTTTTTISNVTTTTTTTIPTTTTTTLPPKEETNILDSIEAGGTGAFEFEDEDLVITDIEVTTTNGVELPSVTISQSSSEPATIAIGAPDTVYGYFTITKNNIEDEDISEVKIKFRISKEWISDDNIDEATIAMQHYVDGAWTALETTKLSEDDDYIYFEAVSSSLSVFAIIAEELAVTTTTTTTIGPATTTTTILPIELPELTTETILYIIVGIIIVAVLLVLWKTKILSPKKKRITREV